MRYPVKESLPGITLSCVLGTMMCARHARLAYAEDAKANQPKLDTGHH